MGFALLAPLGCAEKGAVPAEPTVGVAESSEAAEPAPGARIVSEAECQRIEALALRKSARTLVAACAEGGELHFPAALARATGTKETSGDQRMPEGEYRIAGPARPSRFHRFIPIDYPSAADAERAFAAGRIDAEARDAIVAAHAAGRMPPQDTALGGHLGLHGEGERWRGDLELDWTDGCIAVSDEAIELLGRRAPPGTPLRIEP